MFAVDTAGYVVQGEPPKLEIPPVQNTTKRSKIKEVGRHILKDYYLKPYIDDFGDISGSNFFENFAAAAYSQYKWPYLWAKNWFNAAFPENSKPVNVEGYPEKVPEKLANDWIVHDDVPDEDEFDGMAIANAIGLKKTQYEGYKKAVHYHNVQQNVLSHIDKNLRNPRRSTIKKLGVDIPSGLAHIPLSVGSAVGKNAIQFFNDPIGYVWRSPEIRHTLVKFTANKLGNYTAQKLYHSYPYIDPDNDTAWDEAPSGLDWNNSYLFWKGNHTNIYTKTKAQQFENGIFTMFGYGNEDSNLFNSIIRPNEVNKSITINRINEKIKENRKWMQDNKKTRWRYTNHDEIQNKKSEYAELMQKKRDVNELYIDKAGKKALFYYNIAKPLDNEFSYNRNVAHQYEEKDMNDRLAKKLEDKDLNNPGMRQILTEGSKGSVISGGGGGGSSVWSSSWRSGRKKLKWKKYGFNTNKRGKVKHFYRRRGQRAWLHKF